MRLSSILFALLSCGAVLGEHRLHDHDAHGHAPPAADEKAKLQRLVDWVKGLGGVVRGEVREDAVSGVRGFYATEHIKKGEVFLRVPSTAILNAGHGTASFAESALFMLRELKAGDKGRYWPYVSTLPPPSEVVNSCTIDPYYLPMYKNDQLAAQPLTLQNHLALLLNPDADVGMFAEEPWLPEEVIEGPIDIEQLKYACALTNTRSVGGRNRVLMVPLYDMANHRADCEHHIAVFTSATGRALVMTAGVDLQPGDELCNSYGPLRDDAAFSSYGFLPTEKEGEAPRLADVDEREVPLAEDASEQELKGELQRLKNIIKDMDGRPDTVRPRGEGDAVWGMLKELERRRRRAIKYESERIEGRIREMRGEEL